VFVWNAGQISGQAFQPSVQSGVMPSSPWSRVRASRVQSIVKRPLSAAEPHPEVAGVLPERSARAFVTASAIGCLPPFLPPESFRFAKMSGEVGIGNKIFGQI
jgi:hypothetical protein